MGDEGDACGSVILGAVRTVDGAPIENAPEEGLLACVDLPATDVVWVARPARVRFHGWAASSSNGVVEGLVRVAGSAFRTFTCDQPRPDVVDAGLASRPGGFDFDLDLPVVEDRTPVVLELSDGDQVIESRVYLLRRRTGPEPFDGPPDPDRTAGIFDGQWMEPPPGSSTTVHDEGLDQLVELIGGVRAARVLDLGAAEATRAIRLAQLGASEVVGVERDPGAFLRSLVRKEIVGADACRLLLGDPAAYLRAAGERFDVAFAFDVLEHERDPVDLLRALSAASDVLVVRTRCFDPVIESNMVLRSHFPERPFTGGIDDLEVTIVPYHYGPERDRPDHRGGSTPTGGWLLREGLLSVLDHLGFGVTMPPELDESEDPGGPRLVVVATRRGRVDEGISASSP